MPGDLCTVPEIISLSPFSLATDVSDLRFRASGPWLWTRIRAGGTATPGKSFVVAAHGSVTRTVAILTVYIGRWRGLRFEIIIETGQLFIIICLKLSIQLGV